MAYYFIAPLPERMRQFQNRFDFLGESTWVKDKQDLLEKLPSVLDGDVFFIQLNGIDPIIDDLVITIRQKRSKVRIIFVTDLNKTLIKTHQHSEAGGDSYIDYNIKLAPLAQVLEDLSLPKLNSKGNKLESNLGVGDISETDVLVSMRDHTSSKTLDNVFSQAFGDSTKKPQLQSIDTLNPPAMPDEIVLGDDMSDKDKELSLDDLGDLEIGTEAPDAPLPEEDGMELQLDDIPDLNISDMKETPPDDLNDVELAIDKEDPEELKLDANEATSAHLSLAEGTATRQMNPGPLQPAQDEPSLNIDFGAISKDTDFSDSAKEKLKEIDALMDDHPTETKVNISLSEEKEDTSGLEGDLEIGFSLDDESLVGEPLDMSGESDPIESSDASDNSLSHLNFGSSDEEVNEDLETSDSEELDFSAEEDIGEEKTVIAQLPKEFKRPQKREFEGDLGQDLKDISGAYSVEMERTQATLSNLRTDRQELINKIHKLEDEKMGQNRQILSLRAELDEKKIELSIVRKKLTDENNELKDRVKLFEEKKLILEQKNRHLTSELDKAAQKTKIDIKKVQMRERELEQKLELLKSDAETQIKNRDLKILELKRKLDALEFDMESITVQEKRSVESRYELEGKLDKAIKTLRNAITVLEEESPDKNTSALEALKKSIDM